MLADPQELKKIKVLRKTEPFFENMTAATKKRWLSL